MLKSTQSYNTHHISVNGVAVSFLRRVKTRGYLPSKTRAFLYLKKYYFAL